ncbi:MAG: response regulator [Planctomycetes bacterium]|nr:response regulator [Planctomycetota bacterium]
MRVLAVEDDCVSAEILENSLKHFGFEVTTAKNGREAFELIRTGRYRLVVSDWEMPEMNGVELCRQIRQRQWSSYIYVILVTSHNEVGSVVEGLNAGADDFLAKPFQPEELRVRLRTGERILSLESRDVVIFALAKLAESRDPETGAHLERMREYCRILGEELSRWDKFRHDVDGQYVQLLYLTSPLHDIGKVGIPDRVLLKPGRLTPEEFEIMKQHAVIGGSTLDAAARAYPEAQFLTMAREIALTHHERYDGTGYPRSLHGEEIPLCGRITAVADVYDALTTRRVYKPAISHETAREMIIEGRGTQFDPDVIEAFLRHEEDFVEVGRRFDEQAVLQSEKQPPALVHSVGV